MKKLISTAAFLLAFLLGLAGSSYNKEASVTEYQLPAAQFPVYVAPDSPTNTAPREVSEWVVTNYDSIFSWEDSDGNSYSIHVTLPAIEPVAKFATDYNSSIAEYANGLLDDIKGASLNGEYLTYQMAMFYIASFAGNTKTSFPFQGNFTYIENEGILIILPNKFL